MCYQCDKPGYTVRCSCEQVVYCSLECAKLAWEAGHDEECTYVEAKTRGSSESSSSEPTKRKTAKPSVPKAAKKGSGSKGSTAEPEAVEPPTTPTTIPGDGQPKLAKMEAIRLSYVERLRNMARDGTVTAGEYSKLFGTIYKKENYPYLVMYYDRCEKRILTLDSKQDVAVASVSSTQRLWRDYFGRWSGLRMAVLKLPPGFGKTVMGHLLYANYKREELLVPDIQGGTNDLVPRRRICLWITRTTLASQVAQDVWAQNDRNPLVVNDAIEKSGGRVVKRDYTAFDNRVVLSYKQFANLLQGKGAAGRRFWAGFSLLDQQAVAPLQTYDGVPTAYHQLSDGKWKRGDLEHNADTTTDLRNIRFGFSKNAITATNMQDFQTDLLDHPELLVDLWNVFASKRQANLVGALKDIADVNIYRQTFLDIIVRWKSRSEYHLPTDDVWMEFLKADIEDGGLAPRAWTVIDAWHNAHEKAGKRTAEELSISVKEAPIVKSKKPIGKGWKLVNLSSPEYADTPNLSKKAKELLKQSKKRKVPLYGWIPSDEPETLFNPVDLCMFVVDEAHNIHDPEKIKGAEKPDIDLIRTAFKDAKTAVTVNMSASIDLFTGLGMLEAGLPFVEHPPDIPAKYEPNKNPEKAPTIVEPARYSGPTPLGPAFNIPQVPRFNEPINTFGELVTKLGPLYDPSSNTFTKQFDALAHVFKGVISVAKIDKMRDTFAEAVYPLDQAILVKLTEAHYSRAISAMLNSDNSTQKVQNAIALSTPQLESRFLLTGKKFQNEKKLPEIARRLLNVDDPIFPAGRAVLEKLHALDVAELQLLNGDESKLTKRLILSSTSDHNYGVIPMAAALQLAGYEYLPLEAQTPKAPESARAAKTNLEKRRMGVALDPDYRRVRFGKPMLLHADGTVISENMRPVGSKNKFVVLSDKLLNSIVGANPEIDTMERFVANAKQDNTKTTNYSFLPTITALKEGGLIEKNDARNTPVFNLRRLVKDKKLRIHPGVKPSEASKERDVEGGLETGRESDSGGRVEFLSSGGYPDPFLYVMNDDSIIKLDTNLHNIEGQTLDEYAWPVEFGAGFNPSDPARPGDLKRLFKLLTPSSDLNEYTKKDAKDTILDRNSPGSFNNIQDLYGDDIRFILLGDDYLEGIDIFGATKVIELEPALNHGISVQRRGRAIRRNGQIGLPFDRWLVEYYTVIHQPPKVDMRIKASQVSELAQLSARIESLSSKLADREGSDTIANHKLAQTKANERKVAIEKLKKREEIELAKLEKAGTVAGRDEIIDKIEEFDRQLENEDTLIANKIRLIQRSVDETNALRESLAALEEPVKTLDKDIERVSVLEDKIKRAKGAEQSDDIQIKAMQAELVELKVRVDTLDWPKKKYPVKDAGFAREQHKIISSIGESPEVADRKAGPQLVKDTALELYQALRMRNEDPRISVIRFRGEQKFDDWAVDFAHNVPSAEGTKVTTNYVLLKVPCQLKQDRLELKLKELGDTMTDPRVTVLQQRILEWRKLTELFTGKLIPIHRTLVLNPLLKILTVDVGPNAKTPIEITLNLLFPTVEPNKLLGHLTRKGYAQWGSTVKPVSSKVSAFDVASEALAFLIGPSIEEQKPKYDAIDLITELQNEPDRTLRRIQLERAIDDLKEQVASTKPRTKFRQAVEKELNILKQYLQTEFPPEEAEEIVIGTGIESLSLPDEEQESIEMETMINVFKILETLDLRNNKTEALLWDIAHGGEQHIRRANSARTTRQLIAVDKTLLSLMFSGVEDSGDKRKLPAKRFVKKAMLDLYRYGIMNWFRSLGLLAHIFWSQAKTLGYTRFWGGGERFSSAKIAKLTSFTGALFRLASAPHLNVFLDEMRSLNLPSDEKSLETKYAIVMSGAHWFDQIAILEKETDSDRIIGRPLTELSDILVSLQKTRLNVGPVLADLLKPLTHRMAKPGSSEGPDVKRRGGRVKDVPYPETLDDLLKSLLESKVSLLSREGTNVTPVLRQFLIGHNLSESWEHDDIPLRKANTIRHVFGIEVAMDESRTDPDILVTQLTDLKAVQEDGKKFPFQFLPSEMVSIAIGVYTDEFWIRGFSGESQKTQQSKRSAFRAAIEAEIQNQNLVSLIPKKGPKESRPKKPNLEQNHGFSGFISTVPLVASKGTSVKFQKPVRVTKRAKPPAPPIGQVGEAILLISDGKQTLGIQVDGTYRLLSAKQSDPSALFSLYKDGLVRFDQSDGTMAFLSQEDFINQLREDLTKTLGDFKAATILAEPSSLDLLKTVLRRPDMTYHVLEEFIKFTSADDEAETHQLLAMENVLTSEYIRRFSSNEFERYMTMFTTNVNYYEEVKSLLLNPNWAGTPYVDVDALANLPSDEEVMNRKNVRQNLIRLAEIVYSRDNSTYGKMIELLTSTVANVELSSIHAALASLITGVQKQTIPMEKIVLLAFNTALAERYAQWFNGPYGKLSLPKAGPDGKYKTDLSLFLPSVLKSLPERNFQIQDPSIEAHQLISVQSSSLDELLEDIEGSYDVTVVSVKAGDQDITTDAQLMSLPSDVVLDLNLTQRPSDV